MHIQSLSPRLDDDIVCWLTRSLGANNVSLEEKIQSLWSDQGHIVRLQSDGPVHNRSVLKAVFPNEEAEHPRGWSTHTSFKRKIRSYRVEQTWYEEYSDQCTDTCKVPSLIGSRVAGPNRFLLMEDLSIEYPSVYDSLSVESARAVLSWLASFHATFLKCDGHNLWEEGTYWHLATRQDEFNAMPEGRLKEASHSLDNALREARFQTLVHGDAKLANFQFSSDFSKVAAVDFQYVGRGCGMKDVAYFLGSCLSESDCRLHESALLDHYLTQITYSLSNRLPKNEIDALVYEWHSLYPIAWSDFYRFLAGWMPDHKKINGYTLELFERALTKL